MGAEQKTHFHIDKTRCIKCGKCINTCSGIQKQLSAAQDILSGIMRDLK